MFIPFNDVNPTQRRALITYAIVAINVVGLLWLSRLPDQQYQIAIHQRGFVPARIQQLSRPVAVPFNVQRMVQDPLGNLRVQQRQFLLEPRPSEVILSFLTCMFLHGSWIHLIGNMWFLLIFGDNVEDRLGHLPYLFLYLVGGILASLCHWLMDPTSNVPVIGASGAVACILGAYTITWPWARVRTLVFLLVFVTILEFPALLVLGFWFLLQLLEGMQQTNLGVSGGVAWWAHVGGFLTGATLMPLVSRLLGVVPPPPPRAPPSDSDPYRGERYY